MSEKRREQPIPDPASQHTDDEDTSIIPDPTDIVDSSSTPSDRGDDPGDDRDR